MKQLYTIKPLEWYEAEHFHLAMTFFTNYRIELPNDEGDSYHLNIGPEQDTCFDLLEDAQEAAQKHWERMLLNCLEPESIQDRKTPILEWSKLGECSPRLYAFMVYISGRRNYIEEIEISDLVQHRNCGKKTIEEFVKLRGY